MKNIGNAILIFRFVNKYTLPKKNADTAHMIPVIMSPLVKICASPHVIAAIIPPYGMFGFRK